MGRLHCRRFEYRRCTTAVERAFYCPNGFDPEGLIGLSRYNENFDSYNNFIFQVKDHIKEDLKLNINSSKEILLKLLLVDFAFELHDEEINRVWDLSDQFLIGLLDKLIVKLIKIHISNLINERKLKEVKK